MATFLMPPARARGWTNAGVPAAGCLLYTYAAGTSTPKAAFTDAAGLVPHENPITLDAKGEALIFWDGNYRVDLRTAAGAQITGYPVDNYETPVMPKTLSGNSGSGLLGFLYGEAYAPGTIGKWLKDLSTNAGSSFMGFVQNIAGAQASTVQGKLRQIVTVNDFVTGGDGTNANPWTGWDTGITWTGHTQYDFINGYYSYINSPNFALDHLCLNGKAGTILRHTGIGTALLIDAGVDTAVIKRHVRMRLRLEGNINTTAGAYLRGCVHSEFDIDFHDVKGVCFTDVGSVGNRFKLRHTALTSGMTHQPATLLTVDRRGVGGESSANDYDLIAENCSSYGVILNHCLTSIFRGFSEANANGLFIGAGSSYNNFQSFDLEVNTGGDIDCYGTYNGFNGTLATKAVIFYGAGNTINGGTFNGIRVDGARNKFDGVLYANGGGTFVNNATSIIKHGVYNLTSNTYDVDVMPSQESMRTSTGSLSMANATATTLFSVLPSGRFDIFAYVFASNAANFCASATVLSDGGGGAGIRIIANNGANLTLTIAGDNVQATQTSGAAATVVYSYVRIR